MADEEEIDHSPMTGMTAPLIPEAPVPIVATEDLRRLLATCGGKSFANRRDIAISRLFYDTGMRASELAGLDVSDVDLRKSIACVLGKGRRERYSKFGNKTAAALDRAACRDAHDLRVIPGAGRAQHQPEEHRPARPCART